MAVKRRICLSLLLFAGLSFYASAQSSDTPYTITTIPNATVYAVPKGKYYPSYKRAAYNYVANERSKKVSKPQQYTVVCFTNCNPSVKYDTYVAELRGNRYYIPIDAVSDNHILTAVNDSLYSSFEQKRNAVTENERKHKEAFDNILLGIDRQIELNNKRVADINRNADSLEFEYIKSQVALEIAAKKEKREKYYSWIKTLPASVQPSAERLAITSSYFDGGYAGAFDYCMSFVNWSDKPIKYLYWNGRIKNSVGDYISCQARGKSSFSGRYAGPAPSLSREFASWDHVIFNGEADEMVLTSVKIIYTDGSTYSIGQQALKYISDVPSDVLDKWDLTFDSGYEGLSDEELKAPWVLELRRADFRRDLAKEKSACSSKNMHWEYYKKRIKEWGLWSIEVSNLGWGTTHQKENEPILPELRQYEQTRSARKYIQEDFEKFCQSNLVTE